MEKKMKKKICVEFMYPVFTHMPGKSYRRHFRSSKVRRQGSTLFETRPKHTRDGGGGGDATLIGQHKICATFQYKHICRTTDNAYTNKL